MGSQKLYYTTYKITNLVNGKIYYGMHQTTDLEDGYLGSGVIMERAVKKYGKENFTKEFVEFHNNREEMIAGEIRLIESIDLKCDSNYNVAPGGTGGAGRGSPSEHTQETKDKISAGVRKRLAIPEVKEKMRQAGLGRTLTQEIKGKISQFHLGKNKSPEHCKRISEAKMGSIPWNKGKNMTPEYCKNISERMKGNVPWNKGKKMPPEFGEAISKAKKGSIPWNKGLTKGQQDAIIRKNKEGESE